MNPSEPRITRRLCESGILPQPALHGDCREVSTVDTHLDGVPVSLCAECHAYFATILDAPVPGSGLGCAPLRITGRRQRSYRPGAREGGRAVCTGGPMQHQYPRTERDLRALAVNFSAGAIKRGLPERLECLAAWHRAVIEAEKAEKGEPNDYLGATEKEALATERLRVAGVGQADGEFAMSPCMGPDLP